MEIKKDCRYFQGNIPCKFHKADINVHCSDCKYYDKYNFRILIIKLGSPGDVLRTTSILHGLKEKYKNSYISWITRAESIPLLMNNPYIDKILDYSSTGVSFLLANFYDLILSLDTDVESCCLAEITSAKEKLGFGFNRSGFIYPYNKEAEYWYKIGLFDDLKKENKRTYQNIYLQICKLKTKKFDIILNLTDEEKKFKENFIKKHGIKQNSIKIGLNTGAGERWKQKKWRIENYLKLINLIHSNIKNSQILIYGGEQEKDRNKYLVKKSSFKIIDTSCKNPLIKFCALVDICDIMVCSDTLAMHIATALNKKIIALFGPTSPYEIELYGRGVKIYPDIDCISCYKTRCEKKPNCMDLIKPEQVMRAIIDLTEIFH